MLFPRVYISCSACIRPCVTCLRHAHAIPSYKVQKIHCNTNFPPSLLFSNHLSYLFYSNQFILSRSSKYSLKYTFSFPNSRYLAFDSQKFKCHHLSSRISSVHICLYKLEGIHYKLLEKV